jgi:hypothetical protein
VRATVPLSTPIEGTPLSSAAVSQHHVVHRVLLKAAAGTILLAAAAAGVWEGSQQLAAHFNAPDHSEVSYASMDYTLSMLHKVHHSTARKSGSFVDNVSLSAADVRGIPVDTGQ